MCSLRLSIVCIQVMQAYAALARQPQNSPIAICSLWSAIRLKSVAGRCKCGKSHCSNSKTAMFTLVPHFSTSSEIYKWCSFFLTNMGKASDIKTLKCVVVLQIQARFYTGGMYNPINVFRQFSLKLKCRHGICSNAWHCVKCSWNAINKCSEREKENHKLYETLVASLET